MYLVEVGYTLNQLIDSAADMESFAKSSSIVQYDDHLDNVVQACRGTTNHRDFDIDVNTDGTIFVHARRTNISIDKSQILTLLFAMRLENLRIEYVQERKSKRRIYYDGTCAASTNDFERQMCSFLASLKGD